ncbi:hypothetical protein JAAARDRAFT_58654 [Jaapia argillacea MUCL 33604]|uniref:DUF6533 domain-containing protein n=1 Tax=Jaapia argillacea MUCL 33604 TaxID=933084 RepID=A0A067Q109_9AGAM|nr:hypothetical protein JAAARDRAFT_58654 [Jaapia argillacea MUCL 33604]
MPISDNPISLNDVLACNFSSVAAFAFTLWDICITFDDEVKEIWTRPWSIFKIMFIFLRGGSIFAQVVSQCFYFKLQATTTVDLGVCSKLVIFQAVAGALLMFCCQFVLISRASALYSETPMVRPVLLFLYFAEIIIVTVVPLTGVSGIEYGPYCQPIDYPLSTLAFGVPPVVLDTMLFGLTMVKFYQYVQEGWGYRPLISRFMTDGIWAFALAFLIITLNTSFLAFVEGPMSSILFPWYLAIPSFVGYRLILNIILMFRPAQITTDDPFEVTTNSIRLDTFAATRISPNEFYNDPAENLVALNSIQGYPQPSDRLEYA